MPSRYGPGVLPEPNYSFADFLGGAERGYGFVQGIADRRRQRQQEDEDRRRQQQEREAADRARPGAVDIGTYLQRPGVERDLSPQTLHNIGSAGVPDATSHLEFTPEAGKDLYQTATGPVVSRAAAQEQSLAPYLSRIKATAEARSAYPTAADRGAEDRRIAAAMKAKEVTTSAAQFRTQYPDLAGLGDEQAVRLGMSRNQRIFGNANPTPARPRAAGAGATEADRRVGQRQRERDAAQRALQAVQTEGARLGAPRAPAPDSTGHAPAPSPRWTAYKSRLDTAQARFDRAQAAVDAVLNGGGGQGARRAGAGQKTAQAWIDEVAADPAWASKTDQEIRAEARRRAHAATPARR